MKRNDLKAKNLYTEAEVKCIFESAVLQGVAMCMTALEWHKKWRGKRLTDLYENVKAIAEMPPIFGKNPSAAEQVLHLKETYGIDLNRIQLQIEIIDGSGKPEGVLKR
ncbi:MAG: hypothetical protein Q4D37_10455 [Oscillospiraceae bacterium]|nr:hypothetical protein [Oscillospiraceae bacterium]